MGPFVSVVVRRLEASDTAGCGSGSWALRAKSDGQIPNRIWELDGAFHHWLNLTLT